MERKAPPPRGFGGPPVANGAQSQPFARRNGPPVAFGAPPVAASTEQNAPPPPPQQPQSFGFPAARGPVNTSAGANRRGWRPGRVGGRHDSPLYGKNRKRPSSSSIDSNVSWSGSEIESVGGFGGAHSEQEQVSRLSWASSVAAKDEALSAPQQDLAPAASLFGTPAMEHQPPPSPPPPAAPSGEQKSKQVAPSESVMCVQPPKTPLGKPTLDHDGEISATQRVRLELSSHVDSRAGSQANSSENVFANSIPPVYDEEKSGPQSCPSTFNNTKQPQFSIDKLRQLRSNELVASKLLPTRTSVNSLMGYVRELQLSEATLRKQLVKTKQHTEEELTQSLSKVSELERTMMEVERDRELARRKLEEQEKLIRDLAAKLKQAETAKAKGSAPSGVDELPSIAEETIPQADTEVKAVAAEEEEPERPATSPPAPALPVQSSLPPVQQTEQPPLPPVQPKDNSRAAQFGLASPRSPNRPLWDPWASGGATPMKNLPPVFTIGSTGLDPAVASSTSAAQASATDTKTTARGEYELKSVLMSPRRVQDQVEISENDRAVQHVEQNESTVAAQQEFTPQYPGAVFNVGAMPSPPYPQQEDFSTSETLSGAYGAQGQGEEVPHFESPSQAVPLVSAETVASADSNSFEQQEASNVSAVGDMAGAEWHGSRAQQEIKPSAASFPPPADADTNLVSDAPAVTNERMAPPVPPSFTGQSASPSRPTLAKISAPPNSASAQGTQPEQVSKTEAANVGTTMPGAPPLGSTPSPPPPMSGAQPPSPASPARKENKAVSAEPVSLETLLVDFFTEVDKQRLKMATVYGKRYAGREKWLFAELTKRYGAAKVAALKARYESGTAASTPKNSSDNSGKQDGHAAKSSDSSSRLKAGRQGHPRHPQFFQPPTPASNVDLSAGMASGPPPVAPSQEHNAPHSQRREEAEGAGTPPSPTGKVSTTRAPPGTPPPVAGPPPSFPTQQETGESKNAATTDRDGPSKMNGPPPPPPVHQTKPTGPFNQPPPPLQPGTETSNAAPLGLRQRHNASGPSAQAQKNAGAEASAVTLEGLLKELYRNHQPDKLKNVSIVAKQYAGKERELVGLLKGKYGALSVKRLEENLEVLERSHRARIGGKSAGKKRGCFVRTISLMFWLSVLLYFSFGAVFVSFVVLDAWECRAFDNDEQELESAEECVPLKEELKTFTYERVADYMGQSHSDGCFCSEWKSRENALFTNLSGDDLVNLARLVPFSPDSFGMPWIASVKEQAPSQEFYDSYAKPVVDLSLDVGSFVWSSVLEFAGYGDVSEVKSQTVEDVVENDIAGVPSLDDNDERDADVPSLDDNDERDADTPSLDDERESDATASSLDRAVEEADSENFATEKDSDDNFAEETEAGHLTEKTEADDVFVPSDDIPVEKETLKLDDELQIDGTGITEKEDMTEEDAVEEESATVEEESFSFAPEAGYEQHATMESTDVVESEDIASVEEPESVDANVESADAEKTEMTESLTEDDVVIAPVEETESVDAADADETGVTEALTEDDLVVDPVEETESIGGDDGEVSSSTEAKVVDITVDAAEDVPEAAAEGNEESLGEENAAESDDVVEIEVLQEGVDLSYAETVTDATEEELTAESSDVSSSTLDDEAEPAPDVGEDISSGLNEAEAEMNVESESVSVDSLEESELVAAAAEEVLTMPRPADAVVEVAESTSDVDVTSEVTDVEVENVEEEAVHSAELEIDVVPELSEKGPDAVTEGVASELSIPADIVEVPVLGLESETEIEEVEIEAGEDEFDAVIQGEVEAEEETVNDEEEVVVSEEDRAHVVVEEEAMVEPESEQASCSNDEGKDDEESVTAPATMMGFLSGDADANLDEEDAEVASSSDEDESAVPAEAEALIHELEQKEDVPEVVDETVVAELNNEAFELKEGIDEVSSLSAEIEPVAMDADEVDTELVFPSENDAEILEGVVDEEAEVDKDDAESNTLEVEQLASVVDVVSEVDVESVAIEATEASLEVDTGAAENAEDVTEQLEDVENVRFAGIDEVDISATDETESAIVAEEKAPDAVDEAIAVPADEEALETDDEAAVTEDVPELEETPVNDKPMESVDSADEVAVIADENEPKQVADDTSTTASEEEESGGLASAVNEVLARLVEPFEAAKTAAPDVTTEGEHEL
ncbi:hypothetical protein PC115_g6097 [Phytophthora cactorum]|uniref:Uncharacterized protein n=1 Tax=Phytophthora cactorum TaxID=29920 RepID=A0A8T1D3H3_9STRA|nr:hypothetical protein PC115_g6097 [Phytophthora cactorum]